MRRPSRCRDWEMRNSPVVILHVILTNVVNCRGKATQEEEVPTYAYRCEQCGMAFDEVQSIAEHEAAKARCPKCGSEQVVGVLSAFFAKTSKKS